eukprot:scaffold17405_cov39-Phaeocystis_antarctica.AAC.1
MASTCVRECTGGSWGAMGAHVGGALTTYYGARWRRSRCSGAWCRSGASTRSRLSSEYSRSRW